MRPTLRLAVGLMSGALLLSSPFTVRADDPSLDDPAVVKKLLETKLPLVDKDKLTPGQAARFLADLGGANLYFDDAALRAAGYEVDRPNVFVSAKNVTLATALDRLIKSIEKPKAPLRWDASAGVIILSTASDPSWHTLGLAANENDKDDAFKSDQVIDEIAFEDVALHEALKVLREQGVNVYLHWSVLNKVGVDANNRIHISLKRVHPRTAMQVLVRELAGSDGHASFVLRDSVWAISSPEDLARQTHMWDWRPQHVKDQATADKLANGVEDIGFDAVPFNEALDRLSRLGDVVMDVDWPSLAVAGIDRSTPVTVNVRHLKLATPIDLVLTEAGGPDHLIDYTGKEGTLTIALKKEPATQPTTKPVAKK